MPHPSTFQEAMDLMLQALPMFTRVGPAALKPGLENITKMAAALGNPHRRYPVIHVAGTNGKGSTSHSLAAILQQAGYKVGLHTSPHLKHFCERFRINGQMVDEELVVQFLQQHQHLISELQPSFFEYGVLMAFQFFADAEVDLAIIEVGLGGRLDSTNIVNPMLSIITNISWDHAQLLGNSLEAIAAEKAGIIRTGVPVIIGEVDEHLKQALATHAKSRETGYTLAQNHFQINQLRPGCYTVKQGDELIFSNLSLSLLGQYQKDNLATILAAVEQLSLLGYRVGLETPAQRSLVATALGNVQGLTGLRGRWQVLQSAPLIITDVGHNEAGISAIISQLKSMMADRPGAKLHLVIGMVADKDITRVLSLLPTSATYFWCQANIPRALPAEELAAQATQMGLVGTIIRNVNDALNMALANAQPEDVVFVGGSTFVVAELDLVS